ncbi:MAG: potF 2 [Acidimicrobiales bacterium]|nr:potF 2 [Acidimicrobiales bacterium]
MRIERRRVVALAATIVLLAACGSSKKTNTQPAAKKIGPGEGAVSIVAWAGYIERGGSDKSYDWVTKFEKDTSCKVSVKVAGTSDEMVRLMTTSKSYDLVTASGDASLRLIRGGTVQPVNLDLVPAYKTVDKRLQGGVWYTVDGKPYGVPYQWGPNVLIYNTSVFKTAPTSWKSVFEPMTLPDGKSNKGRVEAYDGAIAIADGALYLKAHQPSLGIKDPYALNQKQFDAVVTLLKGQRKLVSQYWHDTTKQVDDFKSAAAVVGSSWPYQVNTLTAAKPPAPIASTIPSEGATGWADTTMLASNAPHPNCAYKWMQWSLTPKTQGDVASWFGSVPAVPAACDGNVLLGATGCKTNGIDKFDQISFWKTPESNCFGKGGTCVPYSTWVSKYLEIKNG